MVNLLLAAMLAAGPQTDAAKAGMQREMGKALFKEGKLDEAIARFQAAVVLNPADAVAWYNLAYASRKAKKFDQAADAYQRYLKLSPDDPDGYFGLAESLRQAGKPALAVDAYRTYIGKETRGSEQKWVDQAKDRITELEKTDGGAPMEPLVLTQPAPDPTPHLKRGDAAFTARDYRTALFAYQDAILTAPKSAEALSKAGQAYAKLGHDQEAIDAWTKALEIDPNNAPAREGLAAARERRTAQG